MERFDGSEIYKEYLAGQKKRPIMDREQTEFYHSLPEEFKLKFYNIILSTNSQQMFQEEEVANYVVKYIGRYFRPKGMIYFD